MPQVRPETLREVEQALRRYVDDVESSGMNISAKANNITYARHFVRWLNDDYAPGAHIPRPIRRRS